VRAARPQPPCLAPPPPARLPLPQARLRASVDELHPLLPRPVRAARAVGRAKVKAHRRANLPLPHGGAVAQAVRLRPLPRCRGGDAPPLPQRAARARGARGRGAARAQHAAHDARRRRARPLAPDLLPPPRLARAHTPLRHRDRPAPHTVTPPAVRAHRLAHATFNATVRTLVRWLEPHSTPSKSSSKSSSGATDSAAAAGWSSRLSSLRLFHERLSKPAGLEPPPRFDTERVSSRARGL